MEGILKNSTIDIAIDIEDYMNENLPLTEKELLIYLNLKTKKHDRTNY